MYPVRSISLRTVCNTSIAIAVTWAVALAVCAPLLVVFGTRDLEFPFGGGTRTICAFEADKYNDKLYQVRTSLELHIF